MSNPFLGLIVQFGGNFAPRGWALCNGQILPIAQNTALFSILGTTYGGNGQTTFALPDMRSRVPIHPGQGQGLSSYDLGEQTGTESDTLIANNLPPHTHNVAASSTATSKNPSGNLPAAFGTVAFGPTADVQMNAAMISGPTGGPQPFSIIQPVLAINFIIALEGIFPSRN
jgi:microcystin-dependent protein